MKPKDLLFPFLTKEKTVLFDPLNQIFYIPPRTPQIDIPMAWIDLLVHSPFCHFEIGSGNGEWICEKALNEPNKLWVALEMRFDRVRKIWSKMKNHEINNLWILCGRAEDVFSFYLPRQVIDHISINFPDPWPKKRHAKNRLVQSSILSSFSSALKNEGEIDLLTDDYDYHCQMKLVFTETVFFEKKLEMESLPFEAESYGSSYFMRLWQEKKKNFYFLKYKNHVHNKVVSLT